MSETGILIATFNGQKYLRELFESIMQQTYQDFKCYVHDDGSSDNTLKIVREFAERFPDRFEIWDYCPTGSAKNNFISMLKLVETPYVMFCDQDDIWPSQKIEMAMKCMKQNENSGEPCLVFTDMKVVDSNLQVISDSFMNTMKFNPYRTKYTQLLAENVVVGCTMLMNYPLVRLAKQITSTENIRMHDGWCALVAATFGKVEFLDNNLLLYRQHNDNIYGIRQKSKMKKLIELITSTFNGTQKREKLLWLSQIRNLAFELNKLPDLPEDKRIVIKQLVEINEKNKLCRIRFYIDNQILRGHNNIWMLFWV